MIEILEGVFYAPSKEWYEQEQQLIEMGLEIEQTTPIDYEMEVDEANPNRQRLKYSVWQHTTGMGTFEMRVDLFYLQPISAKNFLTKELHNQVTIIKI